MANEADRAGPSIEQAETAGVARVRDALRHARRSKYCQDCGYEIPLRRRQAYPTTRCASCQADRESLAARGR